MYTEYRFTRSCAENNFETPNDDRLNVYSNDIMRNGRYWETKTNPIIDLSKDANNDSR